VQDLVDEAPLVVSVEEGRAGAQLGQGGAQRVDVRAPIDVEQVVLQLLGRHVAQRAEDVHRRPRQRVAARELGQPEVHHHEPRAVRRQQQVLRLEIAVHHPGLVQRVQPLGHLSEELGQAQRLGRRRQAGQVRALDVLHGEVQLALGLPVREDPDHRGVRDAGERLDLAQEAPLHDRIGRIAARDDLERHHPLQPDLSRAVHRPSPAPTELPLEQEALDPPRPGRIGGLRRPGPARQHLEQGARVGQARCGLGHETELQRAAQRGREPRDEQLGGDGAPSDGRQQRLG
jgi:hypothetical protein